jgi:hypothetical protein
MQRRVVVLPHPLTRRGQQLAFGQVEIDAFDSRTYRGLHVFASCLTLNMPGQ